MARIFDVIEYANEMNDELVHRFPDDGTQGDYRLGSNVIVCEIEPFRAGGHHPAAAV